MWAGMAKAIYGRGIDPQGGFNTDKDGLPRSSKRRKRVEVESTLSREVGTDPLYCTVLLVVERDKLVRDLNPWSSQ